MSYEPSIEMRELLGELGKLIEHWTRAVDNRAITAKTRRTCAQELTKVIEPYIVDVD